MKYRLRMAVPIWMIFSMFQNVHDSMNLIFSGYGRNF